MNDFTGKVAIVTGASRGIGLATAERLLEGGALVVISSRKQAHLDEAAVRLDSAATGRVVAIASHGGNPDDANRLVEQTLEAFGRIDILINNAATSAHYGDLLDAELSAWDKTFDVNVRGAYILTRAVVERGMDHGGSIVNVASVGGIHPVRGLSVYNVTKAALLHLTRQLALELGPRGIRVNAVAPGLIRTRFAEVLWNDEERRSAFERANPLGRVGEPGEVAAAIAFLASEDASYVNGHVLVVDGGSNQIG